MTDSATVSARMAETVRKTGRGEFGMQFAHAILSGETTKIRYSRNFRKFRKLMARQENPRRMVSRRVDPGFKSALCCFYRVARGCCQPQAPLESCMQLSPHTARASLKATPVRRPGCVTS